MSSNTIATLGTIFNTDTTADIFGSGLAAQASSPKYVDMLVIDNDIVLDGASDPVLIYDRDCIAQDIKHAIVESTLLVAMIGLKQSSLHDSILQRIEQVVEDDERIYPGSSNITLLNNGNLMITADTIDFGAITVAITL